MKAGAPKLYSYASLWKVRIKSEGKSALVSFPCVTCQYVILSDLYKVMKKPNNRP